MTDRLQEHELKTMARMLLAALGGSRHDNVDFATIFEALKAAHLSGQQSAVLVREAATEPPTAAQTPRVEARRDQIDGAEPALREQKTARHWLIWNAKRGLWWGPDRGGYTDLIRAGLYTEAEAKAQEHDKERMEKAVHISEYRSEVLQAERLIDALYDVDEAVLASSQSALPAAHGSAHP